MFGGIKRLFLFSQFEVFLINFFILLRKKNSKTNQRTKNLGAWRNQDKLTKYMAKGSDQSPSEKLSTVVVVVIVVVAFIGGNK